ncbi:hypothetical protein A8W25_11020 [Streptomyces sp. ERV7]|uniref:hypothetical protein n=1 Tax=Streptomyces sp. ERV7 TaxID=1322334 RepID=UPI0007F558F8|nr:hypothetical protein [Streptomyces sp. ERV7]OAR26015.1 hypothetical protein A8W25_11020 [Streptomyces sp. ERV7]
MIRLRIQVAHWLRRSLVLTDTPRPHCRNCDGVGGIPHDYGHPETGEYDGIDWEPCDCWTQWRTVLLPLPYRQRRTLPDSYSDEPPF